MSWRKLNGNVRGLEVATPMPLKNFLDEALRIVEAGKCEGISIRIMGACAVRLHCPRYTYLHEKLQRKLSDIDLATYSKFKGKLEDFFREMGYKPHKWVMVYFGFNRRIYIDDVNKRALDLFLDKLEMCHTIDFTGRLELDYPTLTLADLFLGKMQIVRLTEKDVKDVIVLLREHDIGDNDEDVVNGNHIAELLAGDWGFYYTFTTNLGKVKNALDQYDALTEEDKADVTKKIDRQFQMIEDAPKGMRWKMRARVGTKKRWYREVEQAPH